MGIAECKCSGGLKDPIQSNPSSLTLGCVALTPPSLQSRPDCFAFPVVVGTQPICFIFQGSDWKWNDGFSWWTRCAGTTVTGGIRGPVAVFQVQHPTNTCSFLLNAQSPSHQVKYIFPSVQLGMEAVTTVYIAMLFRSGQSPSPPQLEIGKAGCLYVTCNGRLYSRAPMRPAPSGGSYSYAVATMCISCFH